MATAYVEWGYGFDCDWGATPLDGRNYSCPLRDGVHDFSAGGFCCIKCGTAVSTCVECYASKCDCSNAKMG